jgi:hypothetical protein
MLSKTQYSNISAHISVSEYQKAIPIQIKLRKCIDSDATTLYIAKSLSLYQSYFNEIFDNSDILIFDY